MIGKNILPSNFNIGDNVIHYRDSSLKGKIVLMFVYFLLQL
jgi:hypothetical protein